MSSIISDLSLIGLSTLNAGSGVVRSNLLRTDNSLRFAASEANDPKPDRLDLVETKLGGIAGFQTTKMSLVAADTALNASIDAAEGLRDTLTELGAIAIQAKADNIEPDVRDGLIERFETLRERMEGQVDQATVAGVNFIDENPPTIIFQDAEGKNIKIETQDLSATGLGISQLSVTLTSEATASDTLIKKAISTLDTRVDSLKTTAATVDTALDVTQRLTHLHVESGVKDLIDPDVTAQNAELRAIDIRQRIGEHALAIANVNGLSFVGLVRQDPDTAPTLKDRE